MSVLKLRGVPSPGVDVLEWVATLDIMQLRDTPLVRLLLNETSGTTAYDTSGNGRDGSYIGSYTLGGSPIGGNGGGSVTFSGGAVELTYDTWMNVTEWTVEALVYPTALSGYEGIATRDNESSERCWAFRLNSGGSNGLAWHSSGLAQANGGIPCTTSTPYLMTFVCGQSGKALTYRNGVEWIDAGSVGTGTTSTSIGIRVGQGSVGGTYPWAGRLSHFAFYGSALSVATIAAHAAAAGF